MSANLYELCVNITANDSEAVKGINEVGHSTEGLSAKAVAMGQIMADAFEAVISKVAEYGQKIVAVGMEQETALAKVNTIMDQSVMSTGQMADAITNLSNDMAISVGDVSDAVYNAISATGDTANAVGLVEQASKLATGGFTDTSSALSTLTTAMNAYHLSAEDAEHISDSLITVQNLGVTTVGELSSSMGKAIASASAYNVNLENLESAYISITKAGINTAEGTTYISSMLKELGDSGSNVSKVLQEVSGKSFDQLMSEGASLGDVLEILNASVDGDATALMNLWSSAEAGKASSAIIGQGIEEFNSNLEQLKTTTGTTETAFETMANTLEYKVGLLQNTGANLMASIYNGMSSRLGDVVGFAQTLMDQLGAGFAEGGIEGLAESFGSVIIQALNYIVEQLPEILNVAIALIEGLGRGLLENSDTLIASIQNLLTSIMADLYTHLPEFIEGGLQMIVSLAEGFAQALPQLIPQIVLVVIAVVDALISNADLLVDGAIALMVGLADGLINALPILIEKAPTLILKLTEALINNVPKLLQASQQIIIKLAIGLITYLPLLLSKIPTLLDQMKQKLIDGAPKFADVGKNIIDGLWQGITGSWGTLLDNMGALADSLIGSFKSRLGIASPSKVFKQLGAFCTEGFQIGIQDLSDGSVFNGIEDQLMSFGTREMTFGSSSSGSGNGVDLENNITITLEGDAKQLFKVMQTQSKMYAKTTGRSAFA